MYKNFNFSYDYEELLDELRSDLDEGLIKGNDVLFIVRGNEVSGYYPIIDYYYDDQPPIEQFEIAVVRDVVKEMEYMNKIIK